MNDTQIQMMRLAAKGYSCSQILIQLALEARGEGNSALVRAMSGLAYGCGTGQATCGALTGGCCLLALYAGKGGDSETASEQLAGMLADLSDWFEETIGAAHGGTTCEQIVGEEGPVASQVRCGGIVAETYEKAMDILISYGFDPSGV